MTPFKPLNRVSAFIASFCLLVILTNCRKEPIVYQTSDQVSIVGYLKQDPETFSEWSHVLDITGNSGFLNAYGAYTHFAPTNQAVQKLLKDMGKTSVEQIDLQELKSIVRFHLLEDTISTQKFTDGKLPVLTMHGQYLTTGAANTDQGSEITINRQANVVRANIAVDNGIIHTIDNVLTPAKLTLAKMLEANPEYSIFVEALKETTLFDTLNILPNGNPDPKKKFLTVLAESNSVLKASGINSYAQLKARYSLAGSPVDFANGLHQFIDYHILHDAKYLADIVSAQSHTSLALPEIITAKLEGDKVLINDVVFNSVYEQGFLLDRATSDVSASNGVLHFTSPYVASTGVQTTGHFAIKSRVPFAVYWDVADFPEIRKQTTFFRKKSAPTFSKASATTSPIAGWDAQKAGAMVTYQFDASGYVYDDKLNMVLGINNRQGWMELKTPLIVRGKYNVWVCYRRQNQSGSWPTGSRTQCRTLIDGVPLAKPFDFTEPIPAGSAAERESLGWKQYTSPNNNNFISKNVGVVDINSTNVHTLRFEVIVGSQSTNNLDMIQFIPVSEPSQILPRFKRDGSFDFVPVP